MSLSDITSSAMIAASDMDRARDFYGGVLGLAPVDDRGGIVIYRTGETRLCVYQSEFAGSNRANAAVWTAGGRLEAVVEELAARGVTFERYDIPGTTFDGRIHHAGELALVWFRDPDGNILHLNNG